MKEKVMDGIESIQAVTIIGGGYEVINKCIFAYLDNGDMRNVEGIECADIVNVHLNTCIFMRGWVMPA